MQSAKCQIPVYITKKMNFSEVQKCWKLPINDILELCTKCWLGTFSTTSIKSIKFKCRSPIENWNYERFRLSIDCRFLPAISWIIVHKYLLTNSAARQKLPFPYALQSFLAVERLGPKQTGKGNGRGKGKANRNAITCNTKPNTQTKQKAHINFPARLWCRQLAGIRGCPVQS